MCGRGVWNWHARFRSVVDSSLRCNAFYDLVVDVSSVPCRFICQPKTWRPSRTEWSCVNPYYCWYARLNRNKLNTKRHHQIWMTVVIYLRSIAGETQLCGHLGQRGPIIRKVGCAYVSYTLMLWRYGNMTSCSELLFLRESQGGGWKWIHGWGVRYRGKPVESNFQGAQGTLYFTCLLQRSLCWNAS